MRVTKMACLTYNLPRRLGSRGAWLWQARGWEPHLGPAASSRLWSEPS